MTSLTLPSTGAPIAVDFVAAENHQLMKMEFGAAGSAIQVSAGNPLPTTTPDISASGTLSAAAQLVNLPLNGQSSANIQITGTWAGTIQFEGTTGGVTFDPINGVFSASSVPATTATVNGTYRITPGALASIQARMSVFGSGSATIAIRASAGTGGTFANQVVPTKTIENGFVSVSNSSAVALGIGGVFTGAAEDVTEYADIRVFVFADQASAVDGLQIQQSSNGTNWDVIDLYNIPAATGKVFSVGVSAKFLRLAYTNGAAAQTAFRLQVKLHKGHSRPSSVRPQDARTNDNDMDEVLSHIMGYNGSGWDRMRGSIANGLVVDVTRIQSTINVAGTRNNNGTGNVAGSFHLTAGGSDGTNLRPLSVDTTGRLNVIGAFFQATQPVSGAFFQATQPVSIAAMPTTPVTGTFFQATQPVSGAFFQTTQPVSLATNTPDVTDRSLRLLGQVTNAGTFAVQAAATLAAETTKVIGTVNVSAAQTIASTQATPANLQMTATPIAITKGTQGATGFTTQDLKDAGRNLVCYYTFIPVLTTATDTLQSLTGTKTGATVVATTTPAVVTTGKTFRVASVTATYIATATSGYAIVRVRAQSAGVAAITSPVVATFAVGNSAPATANSTDCVMEDFPDGSEFAAGVGIGISVQGFAAATATAVGYVMLSINGYEY